MSRPMLLFGLSFTAVMFICSYTGELTAFFALGAGIAALGVYFAVKRLRSHLQIPVACAAVLLAALFFIGFSEIKYNPAIKFDGASSFTGEIISLPYEKNGLYCYDIHTLTIDDSPASVKLCYSCIEKLDFTMNDCISVSDAKIYIPKNRNNEENTSDRARGFFLVARSEDTPVKILTASRSLLSQIELLRLRITKNILERLPADKAGLLTAMLVGDKSHISPYIRTAYSNSGAAHLLAVSGLHVSLWVSILLGFFGLFINNKKALGVIGILFLLFFIVLTAFSPSVLRASFMYLLPLSSVFFSRKAESLNSLGFALFVILAINPFAVQSLSLQLSASAVFGVLTLGKYLTDKFNFALTKRASRNNLLPVLSRITIYFFDIILITLAVTLTTLPVTVLVFGRLSLIAPITNLLVIGLSFIAMLTGAAGALSFLPSLSGLLYGISGTVLDSIIAVVTNFSRITVSVLPIDAQLFAFWCIGTALIILFCIYLHKKTENSLPLRACALSCVTVLLFTSVLRLAPFESGICVRVLPVGNGLSVVVNSGRHYAIIGCGGSTELEYQLSVYAPALPLLKTDFLLVPDASAYSSSNFDYVLKNRNPEQIAVTGDLLTKKNIVPDDSYLIGGSQRFFIWDCLNIEQINTSGQKCVIISYGETDILISLTGNNSAKALASACPEPDFLIICRGAPADSAQYFSCPVIVSGSNSKSATAAYNELSRISGDCFFTAYDGVFTVSADKHTESTQAVPHTSDTPKGGAVLWLR